MKLIVSCLVSGRGQGTADFGRELSASIVHLRQNCSVIRGNRTDYFVKLLLIDSGQGVTDFRNDAQVSADHD